MDLFKPVRGSEKAKMVQEAMRGSGHTHCRAQVRVGDYAGILRNQIRYHQDGGLLARREAKNVSGLAPRR